MRRVAVAVCAVLITTAALANPYIPNRIKYRDTGHQPATGRDGGASIEALSMLDKQGVAEVEIAAAAPGTIERVQIKSGGNTTNYQVGAATFVAPLPGAGRGTPVDVQATVQANAGARMGVISVSNEVLLRPDLRIVGIAAPQTAVIGEPVQIIAGIQELNGDLGARATCSLRVDGELVDQATNIWVDAEGSVACSFLHEFSSLGEKTLSVTVEDVSPRDYDPTNQQWSRTIRITEDLEPTSWAIFVNETASWMRSRMWSQQGQESVYNNDYWRSESTLSIQRNFTTLNMNNIHLRYSEKSGGNTVVEVDSALTPTPLKNFRQCARYLTADFSVDLLVCEEYAQPDRRPYDRLALSLRRNSVDATYYSHESAPAIDGEPAYDREYYVLQRSGPQVRFGDSVSYDVAVSDGTQTMVLRQEVPLELIVEPDDHNLSCWDDWCQESWWGNWRKSGFGHN
jgi:hypothetical protein